MLYHSAIIIVILQLLKLKCIWTGQVGKLQFNSTDVENNIEVGGVAVTIKVVHEFFFFK